MGWGLAGTGIFSAVAAVVAAAVAVAPGGRGSKLQKLVVFFKKRCENIEKKNVYRKIEKMDFRKLRWGPLDSADRCVLKS